MLTTCKVSNRTQTQVLKRGYLQAYKILKYKPTVTLHQQNISYKCNYKNKDFRNRPKSRLHTQVDYNFIEKLFFIFTSIGG